MLKTILSISGKPGLFKLVSHGKNMLIVDYGEQLEQGQGTQGSENRMSGKHLFPHPPNRMNCVPILQRFFLISTVNVYTQATSRN